MSISLPFFLATLLLLLTAAGYAIATFGMKLASDAPSPGALTIIVLGLACATIAEVALLRGAALSVIYVAIVATETLLVLLFAMSLGEGLSVQQAAGGALVLGGVFLVALTE